MDRIEKAKLYLVWLSCKDFESLRNRNRKLLEQVWKKVRKDMEFYFKGYSVSLDSIMDKFQTVRLTIDPRKPFGYDPHKDSLVFNLWKLFFTLLTDESSCTPKLPWQLGGGLIHEYDHYNFLQEHNMIGKPEEAQVEFAEEFMNEAERRAYSSELGFYESCRSILSSFQTYTVRVKKWTKAGKPMQKDIQMATLDKEIAIINLDSAVKQIEDVVRRIESGEPYDSFSADRSIADCQKLAELLSLPIKFDVKRKDYPYIEIKM